MKFEKAKTPSELPEDTYLSAEEVFRLQHLLLDRSREILDGAAGAVHELTQERTAPADAIDLASSESDRDFSIRIAQREHKLISKIETALQSIAEGEYGECQECGEAIGYRRQLIRPVARMCIDCKTQTEKVERIAAM
jgi:DnaK suppressor protein